MATHDEHDDATADHSATTAEPPTAESTPATPARGIGGLALAGIIGGGVVTAALLFGGGLAVGVALPDRAPFGTAQIGMPGMQEGHPGAQEQHRGDDHRAPHRAP